jgi:carbon storage regulator CsrA
MLVLARKQSERILIIVDGKVIEVKITEIRQNVKVVRVGITAPTDVRVLRPEMLEKAKG